MARTPGPWRADLHHTKTHAGRNYGFVRADGIVPLALVTLGVEGVSEDEGRANLHVFAASEQMLAALEGVAEPWSAWSDESLALISARPSKSKFAVDVRNIIAVRAAIKAARGES